MYNISSFYQSELRQHINEHIYHKPVIYIDVQDQKYQCIIHDKKILGRNLCRCQILWISSENLKSENISDIKKQINIQLPKKSILIYIQFGISDNIDQNNNLTSADIVQNLSKSLRENMPAASTYIYTDKQIDELYASVGKSHKAHIKKALSRWVTFEVWNLEDKEKFYEIWAKTAGTKWFGIFSKKKFDDLVKYIYDNQNGKIFLAKLDWQIIWWAVCLFVELDGAKVCIYLYGMTDREAGNIGTNQFLHREIIKRCHENNYNIYDFLWISGIDDDETHHLAGVTKFKLWFGGKADYIIWSYDLVTNKYIYRLYQKIAK